MPTKTKPTRPPMDKFQYTAVETMMERDGLLVEYGTGTGKSRIIAEAGKIFVRVGDIPGLVIVPSALIEQTYEEFQTWVGRKWADKHVAVLGPGMTIYQRVEALKRGRSSLYLLGHESLSYGSIREALVSRRWAFCMLDEASRFRNHSNRVRSLNAIAKRTGSTYAFTANLMVKTPADVFYVMNYIDRGVFGTNDRHTFITEYCTLGGYMGNTPIDIRPEKLPQLLAIMDAHRIRCELKDIRKLPRRDLTVYRTDMHAKQRVVYQQMRDELKVELERMDDAEFKSEAKTYSVRLLRLQEIAAGFARDIAGDVAYLPSPKTAELLAILQDTPDTPTIVWYWWRPELEVITAALKRAKIPHSVFGQKDARPDFLSGKTNVFVAQLAKGGFGLNLARATRMIYHSLPWDLDVYLQSQERNMRRNTTAKYLEVIHLLIRGSVDEYVRTKLIGKSGLSRKLSRSQALELLNSA